MAKRRRSWKRSTEKAVYGWYRPSSLVASNMSGTTDGIVDLGGAEALMPSSSLATYPLDISSKGGRLIVERLVVRIIAYAVSTGIAQLIKFVWGIRMDEQDRDGTLRPAADMPRVLVAGAEDRREDWLWRGMQSLQVGDTLGGTYMYPSPNTEDNIMACDTKPRRPFGDRMHLVFHWHADLIATPGTNPDSVHVVNVEPEVLLRLPSSR